MDLKKKLGELEQQLEVTRSSFFQIQGAIAIVREQIREENKPITQAPSEVTETETDGNK